MPEITDLTPRDILTPPSGWTTDTLHHLMVQLNAQMELRYQQRFMAQQEAVSAALLAAERGLSTALSAQQVAVAKAETANEKRFDSVNEFRAQLGDQARTFMTRSEAEIRLSAITDQLAPINNSIEKLRDNQAANSGKEGARSGILTTGIAIVAVLISLAFGLYALMPHPNSDPPYASTIAAMAAINARLDTLSRQITAPPAAPAH